MHTDSIIQSIVFAVNMLSFSIAHVNSGNTKYDAANPINLPLHAAPVSSKINLLAYQKHRPTGIE